VRTGVDAGFDTFVTGLSIAGGLMVSAVTRRDGSPT
jgi:hypothetical protein